VSDGAEPRPHPAGTQPWRPPGGTVERVLLLADGDKPVVAREVGPVAEFLEGRGAAVEVHRSVRELRHGFRPASRPDLVVVLGGDGSVLTAARLFEHAPVATIGVNFGRVGFLASLQLDGWRRGLADVVDGRALVENRMRLVARVAEPDARGLGDEIIAMNDVVISRGGLPSMVEFELMSGGRPVTRYRADGIIFATPSGSTAYSLAAGGPILDPALRAIVLTPISAHALAHRPLVVGPRAPLEARVASAPGPVQVDVDGHTVAELREGDTVVIGASETPYPLLTLDGFDPWQRLRDRLGWSGEMAAD